MGDEYMVGVKVLAAPAALEAEAKRLKLRSEIPEMALLAKVRKPIHILLTYIWSLQDPIIASI